MRTGRGGIESHKHGVSGHSGKSPKLRAWLKLEAEKSARRARKRIGDMKSSVQDLFQKKG